MGLQPKQGVPKMLSLRGGRLLPQLPLHSVLGHSTSHATLSSTCHNHAMSMDAPTISITSAKIFGRISITLLKKDAPSIAPNITSTTKLFLQRSMKEKVTPSSNIKNSCSSMRRRSRCRRDLMRQYQHPMWQEVQPLQLHPQWLLLHLHLITNHHFSKSTAIRCLHLLPSRL